MKGFFVLLLVFSVQIAKAQFSLLQQNLLELQQQVYQKDFSKKWIKTTKKNWEQKCNSSKTVAELNTLFNQFSDLFAQVTDFSMGNSDAKTEVEFAQYLLKVKNVIKKEYIPKWSETAQKEWVDRLNKIIEDERIAEEKKRIKEEGEKQVARLMFITNLLKDFETNFKTVFEDSKKNGFKSIRSGEISGIQKKSSSTIVFNLGSKPIIQLDQNNTLCYQTSFECNGDQQLAEKVLSEIMIVIIKNIPSDFKKNNQMDAFYLNKNKYVFEFVGAKFSDTAKNPTITIGIEEATKNVVLIITEPVFGK
jgi:hypothetical protein